MPYFSALKPVESVSLGCHVASVTLPLCLPHACLTTFGADIAYLTTLRLAKQAFTAPVRGSAPIDDVVTVPAGHVSVNVTVLWPTFDRLEPPVENRFEVWYQLEHTVPTSLWDLFQLSEWQACCCCWIVTRFAY